MPNVQHIIAVGHLGQDAETSQTSKGSAMTKFSVAVKQRDKDSSGQWISSTVWHSVTAFGLHESLVSLLVKGAAVQVIGPAVISAYVSKKTNEPAVSSKITARDVTLVGAARKRQEEDDSTPF